MGSAVYNPEAGPITTEEEYQAALERIDTLMGAEKATAEGVELESLVTQVEAYEAKIGFAPSKEE